MSFLFDMVIVVRIKELHSTAHAVLVFLVRVSWLEEHFRSPFECFEVVHIFTLQFGYFLLLCFAVLLTHKQRA